MPTSAQPTVAQSQLVLSSPAFDDGGPIPERHSCDGEGLSPSLAWGQVPAGTVELAITVTDPDAGGFVNWVVTGVDPAEVAIGDGGVSDGHRDRNRALASSNSFRRRSWRVEE